jgi:hypothetical protein
MDNVNHFHKQQSTRGTITPFQEELMEGGHHMDDHTRNDQRHVERQEIARAGAGQLPRDQLLCQVVDRALPWPLPKSWSSTKKSNY